jgi:hypothetical protein
MSISFFENDSRLSIRPGDSIAETAKQWYFGLHVRIGGLLPVQDAHFTAAPTSYSTRPERKMYTYKSCAFE